MELVAMSTDPGLNDFFNSLGINADGQQEPEERPMQLAPTRAQVIAGILATNSESLICPGFQLVRHFPMVSARQVVGQNAWKDFLASVRDAVGGRSKTVEATLAKMEQEILSELKWLASKSGANAIVSTRIEFGEISGGSVGMMFFATGYATPVLLEQV